MKNLLMLVLATFAPSTARAQVAMVHDPINHSAIEAQSTLMSLHNQFMKLQMVQDAVVLKNTYLESKAYYDTIAEHSKHQGGLMGYYKDYYEAQLTNMAEDEWRKLHYEGTSVTGATPVDKVLANVADSINAKVDQGAGKVTGNAATGFASLDSGYGGARAALFLRLKLETEATDKMIATSQARKDDMAAKVADLVRQGSDPVGISQTTREKIELQARLMELQIQMDMLTQLNLGTQVANSKTKANIAESAMALQASQDVAAYGSQSAKARKTSTHSASDVGQELRRLPGR